MRNIFLAAGGLLTLLAVGPSSCRFVWEDMRKGKPRYVDPDTVIPKWKEFCQSMGIKEDIKVKVFPNLRNAYARGTTIAIGQPVIDSLDSVSMKGVFAHELAHIKEKHGLKQWLLLFGVLSAAVLLLGIPYSFGPLGSSTFSFPVLLLISVGFAGVAARFISWPFEYRADLMADLYVKQRAVASCLVTMAVLRKIDITRDFYFHPSLTKRIASLDGSQNWSRKTRFKRWYFEL